MPSVWVTDPRVRWQPVDDDTVLLQVPFARPEQTLLASFDPNTGLLQRLGSIRSKDEGRPWAVLTTEEVLTDVKGGDQLVVERGHHRDDG